MQQSDCAQGILLSFVNDRSMFHIYLTLHEINVACSTHSIIKLGDSIKEVFSNVAVKLSGNMMVHTLLDSFFICEIVERFSHCLELFQVKNLNSAFFRDHAYLLFP